MGLVFECLIPSLYSGDWKASLTNLLIHHNSGKVRQSQPVSKVWESNFSLQHQYSTLDPRDPLRGLLCNSHYSCKSMNVNDVYIDLACVRTTLHIRIYPLLFAYFQCWLFMLCKLQVLDKKKQPLNWQQRWETHCVPPDSFEKNKKDLSYFAYFLSQPVIMCLLKRVLSTAAAFNTLHVWAWQKWEAEEKQWSGYSF